MPAFAVSAIDRMGIRRSLREDAPDSDALKEILRTRGLWAVRVRVAEPSRKLERTVIPTREFVAILHQLELQLRAGVTADAALRQLAEDAPSAPAEIILQRVCAEVAQGMAIHRACRFFSRQFPPHVAAVIEAGEASAQLPEALHALSEHLANVETLRRTARKALIYPVIVLTATVALIVFMLGGVVPQFAAIFSSLRMTLPWPTQTLIAASEVVRHAWPWLLGASVLAPLLAAALVRTPRGRMMRDRALLRAPLLGDTLRHLATARFAAHVRLLHDAGVPMLQALATGAELTANAVLAGNLAIAREGIAQGQPLHAALPKGHAFPRFVVPALKSGESTGQLGPALRHIEAYASGHAQARLAMALAMLEPALISVLTAVVGFIALSFFLPMFQLLGGIK